jgi:hypothetical protein
LTRRTPRAGQRLPCRPEPLLSPPPIWLPALAAAATAALTTLALLRRGRRRVLPFILVILVIQGLSVLALAAVSPAPFAWLLVALQPLVGVYCVTFV